MLNLRPYEASDFRIVPDRRGGYSIIFNGSGWYVGWFPFSRREVEQKLVLYLITRRLES